MSTEFLQSKEWLRLQEATGKSVVLFEQDDFVANGIVHTLPVVGRYLYVPRGPIFENAKLQMPNVKKGIDALIALAREKKMKWVRIEPGAEEMLGEIKKSIPYKVARAPHDMQPREILQIDITEAEEVLLAQMKPKTRYNIRLAEKRGVKVFETRENKYITAFLDLITATSGRKGITSHPRSYYQQFFQTLPETLCRLFVAEYQGVVVASNIVFVYGDTATYLHGGTADVHRDVMAPYLLQWEQIKKAKTLGCTRYDFGGVKTESNQQLLKNKSDWGGITKFKMGFSPRTAPTVFPGSYDIILDSTVYSLYDALRHIQKLKRLL
ncbi:MAG: peptidoglycan bridge formation glycyltransferase FemA/FemB family protein [Candidatus Moranbacteria bacterium]|nr:peptidoglycan bridge formation glycyltransferase FemA/FemB family protein [Candidatus Moranbacteria bacterium]